MVRSFGVLRFYEADSDTYYRSYGYLFRGCGVDTSCWDSDDDTLFVYRSSDGTTERLFVESPERPFYLERDKEDSELARLVITFVPALDAGSENAEK